MGFCFCFVLYSWFLGCSVLSSAHSFVRLVSFLPISFVSLSFFLSFFLLSSLLFPLAVILSSVYKKRKEANSTGKTKFECHSLNIDLTKTFNQTIFTANLMGIA